MSNRGRTDNDHSTRLGLLEHHAKQFALQRDVIDRWFRFYLAIVAAPFAVFAVLVESGVLQLERPEHKSYLGIVGVLLFFLGLEFFHMNTVQRGNSLKLIRELIKPLEDRLWRDLMQRAAPHFTAHYYGADFAVGLVIATTNAAWLTGSTYLLWNRLGASWWCPALLFVGALLIQMVIRHIYLSGKVRRKGAA